MEGYQVDPVHLGLMAGTMDDISGEFTSAARALGGAVGGDLGHASINSAVGQLMSGLGSQLGQFGTQASGLSQSLLSAQQAYGGVDGANAALLGGGGIHDPRPGQPSAGEPQVTKQPYYGDPTRDKAPRLAAGPDPEIHAVPILPAAPADSAPEPVQSEPSTPDIKVPYAGTGVRLGPDGAEPIRYT